LYALTLTILSDFQNYFTVRIRRTFVIILSLKIPPHLMCVTTLPCEISGVLKATGRDKERRGMKGMEERNGKGKEEWEGHRLALVWAPEWLIRP